MSNTKLYQDTLAPTVIQATFNHGIMELRIYDFYPFQPTPGTDVIYGDLIGNSKTHQITEHDHIIGGPITDLHSLFPHQHFDHNPMFHGVDLQDCAEGKFASFFNFVDHLHV